MHREGRLEEALAIYREITLSNAAGAEPWQLRAMAEQQSGQLDAARSSIAKAIEIDAARPSAHLVAGHIAADLRDLPAAESSFRSALELKPDWVAAWNSLGMLLLQAGRAAEAETCFQRSLALDGKAPGAWSHLGLALLALERFDDAIRAFNYAATLEPRFLAAYLNLSRAYESAGRDDLALTSAQAAVRLDPRSAEARVLLADLQRKGRDLEGARESYAAAAELDPAIPRPGNLLADLLWEMGLADEARATFAQVAQRHPGSFRAAVGSRLVLPAVYKDADDLERTRRTYQEGLAALLEDEGRFRYSNAAEALQDVTWTNFYLPYQGGNDRELQAGYGKLVDKVLRPVAPEWLSKRARSARRHAKLRIGFFSHFFFNCTVGRYFASWIRELDPDRFEKVVYYTNPWMADDTRAIASSAQLFRHLPRRPVHALAQQVLADDLDVLVYPELGMNPETFTLASLRLAPVQVAGWGHPTTTGLASIDWFLSCESMEPDDAPAHYVERLATLPGLGTRYARPSAAREFSRADFGLPEHARLYLVPQSLFKIHPDNDALFAEILARDPEGRIVMFAGAHRVLTDRFVARLRPHLDAVGAGVRDRILFLPFMPHADYLGVNQVCDVMLDTLHWSGGNTSLDALAIGLPVITLPGAFMRGRQTLGMSRMLDLPELVAADIEDYVEKAVSLARDPAAKAALSARMLANAGAMFDREEPVRAFEKFLESAVAQS